jgi:hypothetical protein
MNLRFPVLCVALLSIAATGDPCDQTGSTGTGSTGTGSTIGPNDAVCEVSINTPCCVAVNDPCSDNNDCCGGNCSGSSGADSGAGGAFGDAGSTCAEPVNEECTVALGSRCNTGQCECTTDNDCCLGNCEATIIPGVSGHRCCLESGLPCDADADCCSLTCQDSGQCE